jgi:hypothetical protein
MAKPESLALTANQIVLGQLGLAGLFVMAAVYLAPVMTERLSKLPVIGVVTVTQVAVPEEPNALALPAAIALPTVRREAEVQDLAILDEMFLPPVVVEEKDSKAEVDEQAMRMLSSIQVNAASSAGAFVNGDFFSNGSPIGMAIADENGQPLPVLAFSSGNTVTLRAGAYSRSVVIE